MDTIPSTQFDGMCRTCMGCQADSTDSLQLQSLFGYIDGMKEAKIHIFEIFHWTIQVLPKIEITDQLPKSICKKCLEKLSAYYEFQQCCVTADSHYRKLLATNGIEEVYAVDVVPDTMPDPLQHDTVGNSDILELEEFIKQETDSQPKKLPNEEQIDIEDSLSKNDDLVKVQDILEINKGTDLKNDMHIANAEDYQVIKSNPKLTMNRSFACEKCNKIYMNKKSLLRHSKCMHNTESSMIKKTHNREGTYKCKECGVAFLKKLYLERHKNDHKSPSGAKVEKKCEYCNFMCKSMQALRKHCHLHHKDQLDRTANTNVDPKKPHICQYCNKGFQQSCTLKDHIRIHTKEQPFLCSHCGKGFNSNSNLQQHLLRHTGERRYECPDCPKKFPCLSDLSSHKQVHKKLRPHICDTCGSAFGKPFQLKKHKMYHSGEKPFQCEYCEMRFVCADHMRRHMRTHTGEKPYKCKYCTRTFTQSNDMVKHLRLHLGENVYLCELCPMTFRLATELREHFSIHKNEDQETRERNKQALLEAQEKLRMKLELDRAIGVNDSHK